MRAPAIMSRASPDLAAAAAWATALSVALAFAISHLMMGALGLAYEVSGGAAWQKIHPATYVGLLALALAAIASGDPVGFVERALRRHPGLAIFAATWALLFAQIAFVLRTPFTAIIDTFLLPMALLVLLPAMGEGRLRRLAWALHAFMAANAILAVAEFAFGFRLTPIVAQGLELTSEWRSSALLGHPLANAAATAGYLAALLFGGGRDLPPAWRAAAFALQLPAMIVFGGRAATAMVALLAAGVLVWRFRAILSARIGLPAAAGAILAVTAGVAAVAGLAGFGFFDRFLSRFVEDNGSAAARLSMFELLAQIPPEQLLLGPDPDYVSTLQRLEGIAFGIESFWVAMIAQYGALVALPFFVGMLAFHHEVTRRALPGAWTCTALFLAISSTSVSQAGKSMGLAIFVATTLILLRRRPTAPDRA